GRMRRDVGGPAGSRPAGRAARGRRRRGVHVQRPGRAPGHRADRRSPMTSLPTEAPVSVATAGADLLATALEAQATHVDRVDWQPPMEGTAADLAAVATDPRRRDANA